jgi:uncharacterized protein (DUF1015 family)
VSLVRPFGAWLPRPDLASAVASPPLGELTTREWIELSSGNPLSFLHVIRTEIDSVEGGPDPAIPEVSGRARLDEMIGGGVFHRPTDRGYFIYRIERGGHTATGIIAEVHVAGYSDGRIRRHEHTRSATEELVVDHLRRIGAHSDPVGLTHADDDVLSGIVAGVCRSDAPAVAFTSGDVTHTIWVVDDAATLAALQVRLDRLPALYITDGHHRCAACLRFAEERAMADPEHAGDEDYHYLLAALFPQSELRLLEFNRCLCGLGLQPDRVVERLGTVVDAAPAATATPPRRGVVGVTTGDRILRFDLPAPAGPGVRDALDVVRLQDAVLAPAFGIAHPRTDPRLHYVAASATAAAHEECDVCFHLYPTAVEDVMRIADLGEVMPPKSTWFEPKVWGGLFVDLLDG